MNCRRFEKLIALYVEGDLAGRELARVEAHLAECPGCCEFAAQLEETQSAVRALRSEPVDEAELAAIRARVLERIREAPQRGWSWRMAYAMAAVVMVVAGVVWFNRPENAPPELPRPVIAVAPTPVVVAQAAPVAKRRRPARPKPVLKEERPAEPLLVKLETSDPDVIIYWIVESKGG